MKILGNVNGPRNRGLNSGDVLDSGGTFKALRPKVIITQPTMSCNLVLVIFLSLPLYMNTHYITGISHNMWGNDLHGEGQCSECISSYYC